MVRQNGMYHIADKFKLTSSVWLDLVIVLFSVSSLLLILGSGPTRAQAGHGQGTGTAEPNVQRVPPGGAPPAGSGTIVISDFVRGIDGDTLEIHYKGSQAGIGLIGIEAPQGNTSCGKEAADRLQALVMGGVRLEEDRKFVFDDNRGLRMYYVLTPEGRSAAKELVSAGVARATGEGNESEQLMALQAAARKDKRGCLWGGEEASISEASSATQVAVGDLAAVDSGGELSAAAIESGFTKEVVTKQLNVPTAFTFLPDGRILIAEKSGRVRVYKNGALLPQPLIDISGQVNNYWDRGLLGIAADPNFSSNGYVYLLFTYENDPAQYDSPAKTARLIRVTATGDTAAPASEKVILGHTVGRSCKDFPAGADCIPSDYYSHTIGNLKFASDGSLFVSTGDGADFDRVHEDALRSQDVDSLAGKLLHITTEGKGIADNPFWNGSADANRSKVWAYGLRNPYRFNLRPGSGIPYLGDVGWNNWEEINVATKGANLGWPCYEGIARQAGYEPFAVCQNLYAQGPSAVRSPLVTWPHNGGGAAATGGAFYTGTSFPAEYRNAYFYGDYGQSVLRYLHVDVNDQLVGSPIDFIADAGGPVDIEMGPDGNLYYLAINVSELYRVRYVTTQDVNCQTGEFKAEYFPNRTLEGTPLIRRCENSIDHDWGDAGPGDGIGNDSFSARWIGTFDFAAGDHTFTARTDDGMRVWVDGQLIIDQWRDQAETYQATRTMSAGPHEVKVEYYENGGGAVAQLGWQEATPNAAPTPTISSPSSSFKWKVGDVINYSGSATDPEDGTIPSTALDWKVILHHCPGGQCHLHPLTDGKGMSGSFVAPDHGDESYFEIVLTATDSGGKTGKTSVEIRPQTSQITLDTLPSGLQVVYGGEAGTAPLTRTTVVGSSHTILAPSPQGSQVFESWSDGGARQHNVTAGANDAIYTATFTDSGGGTSCASGQFRAQYFNNKALEGNPVLERCEDKIDYNWGDGGPDPGVNTDNFSVRWVGTHNFEASEYTFSALSDDGVRMWVDGELLIDAWKDQGPTKYTATRAMTAGEHTVRVEYYENGGGAVVQVGWKKILAAGDVSCPTGQFLAEYYDNMTLSGAPSIRRCEATIDNDWGAGGPGEGVGADNFSARWVGIFDFETGVYTFSARADDGVRVFVDGEILIDQWRDQGPDLHQATRILTAGSHQVKVEYYENGAGAVAEVGWLKSTDTTAPTVSGVAPPGGATNVATTANAEATFSEEVDPNTVTTSTFTLTKQGATVPAQVRYDQATKMATLDPTADLGAGATYTATIKGGASGVKDQAGNSLGADKTWSFTTAAAPQQDTTPPETTIDSGPSGTVKQNNATFAFSSSEANSTFECKFDGATFSACVSPKKYTGLASGSHTFSVRAIDGAKNVDATPASRTWTIRR